MNLSELVKQAHGTAVEKGWWAPDKERRPLELHMLICSEVAEASEAVRNGDPAFWIATPQAEVPQAGPRRIAHHPTKQFIDKVMHLTDYKGKPEGEAVELADAIIRIADYFGHRGWDLDAVIQAKLAYNATRGYRHGNKTA